MKQIYLHIGKHKTGTSALQWFLLNNQERLRRDGFYYPEHSLDANRVSSGNAAAFSRMLKADESQARTWAENLSTCEYEKIILSSEFLYVLDEPGIHQLRDFFNTIETRVIVYLRRQDFLMMSGYNQLVKRRGVRQKIGDWWPANLEQLRWTDAKLHRWADVFGSDRITVRLYEQEQLTGGNLFADFLSVVGLKLTHEWHLPDQRINTGYRTDPLECMRLFNHLGLDEKQQKRLDWLLQEYSDQHASNEDWPYRLLSPADRCRIIDYFAAANAQTACRFLNRRDGILFYEPLPDRNEPWQPFEGVSPENARAMIRFLADRDAELFQTLHKTICRQLRADNGDIRTAAGQLLPGFERVCQQASKKRTDLKQDNE
jgi:hypothetical protein